MSKEEIDQLLQKCSRSLRLAVVVALNTGLRKSELQSLRWGDIYYEQEVIRICNSENGEPRDIPMNEAVKVAILSMPRHPEGAYVFCGKDGIPYNFRKAFETAVKRAGISDFRWHDLRHTYASHLAMAGVDLNTIRELLGHKSLAMTQRYSHLSKGHKAKAAGILHRRLGTGTSLAQPHVLEESHKSVDSVTPLDLVS